MSNQKITFGKACAVALGLCAVFALAGCDYQDPHKKPKNPHQHVMQVNPVSRLRIH